MIAQAKNWNKTPVNRVGRTKFNLSHERRLTADMFFLYPILVEECIPSDHWKIGNSIVCRLKPLVAPLMHEINIYVHYYFIPFRILDPDWEDSIFGGVTGDFAGVFPKVPVNSTNTGNWTWPNCKPGGLLDHLYGMRMLTLNGVQRSNGYWPSAFYLRAYNMIWNEFYRSQDYQNEVDINDWGQSQTSMSFNFGGLKVRAWAKDYFTTALPDTQRGQKLSIPLVVGGDFGGIKIVSKGTTTGSPPAGTQLGKGFNLAVGSGGVFSTNMSTNTIPGVPTNGYNAQVEINTGEVGTFNVNDLRWLVQAQLWMEMAQRGGVRYIEGLRMFFNASPTDDRLDRPEYIGGTVTPIIISEVLQTSVPGPQANTNGNNLTPLGTMAGHGISADRQFVTSYYVKEHGCIIGLLSIMPKPMYYQAYRKQFVDRDNKFKFYWPQFRNLSEQAVTQKELTEGYQVAGLTDTGAANLNAATSIPPTLGYQGRWDEYRYIFSTVHGEFLELLKYWHMARIFSGVPYINKDFLYPTQAEMTALKRPFAVQNENEFMLAIGNNLHVTRPLPFMSLPGLVDHA